MMEIESSSAYIALVANIKQRVISARISAARAVNRDLIELYWDIGRMIVEKQKKKAGANLSRDLKEVFPGGKGFSSRNLWDMKRFYEQNSRH